MQGVLRKFLPILVLLAALFIALPMAVKAAPLLAPVLNVVDGPGVGSYSSTAVNASGNPVISYYDSVNGTLRLAACNDPNCNSAAIRILDNAGDVGGYTSIVLDSGGRPVVSYYSWEIGDLSLKLARCGDPTCNTVTVTTVEAGGAGNVGQHTSIALDALGNPVIAYHDEDNGTLKLVHCANPTCATPHSSMNVVDSTGANVGPGVSLVLNASGIPVISYRANNDALRLATCNALDCDTPTIVTLDGPPASAIAVMPSSTSLALNAAGHPVISYHGNGELRLARCSNPTCAGFDPIAQVTIVDPVGAQYNEMALDSSGNPVIAYFDTFAFSVKLAHCVDPDCASVTPLTVDTGGGTFISMALGCNDNAVMAYQHLGGLKVASDDACSLPPSSPTGSAGPPSASKPIAPSGITSLGLGRRIIVYVPAEAIPTGQTNCTLTIREDGESGRFGFALDDTVWDVKITCDSSELKIFMAPLTTCILPLDNTSSDKNVYHRHNLAAGFQAIAGGSGLPGWVCGQTRVLSLFTLGQLSLPATGFAPGVVTNLGAQPAELAYAASSLTLSIPKLGVHMDILGVPQGPNGWDVTWLSANQAGYLYGTAFPTWKGNSVLTAHVWNADNMPGPFHDLKILQHGDRFSISAYGYTYTYEVRSNRLVSESNLNVLTSNSDYSQITLITCESYSERSGGYLHRRAVQAVLVSVDS
ncbi:MAG: sortase [Anaerolineales bacterium]|nr:sortase [Anaerolineales bacterium]